MMPTQTIKYHPGADRLTAFSAGALPLSQALCISAHLQYCQQCRRHLTTLNQVGSQLFSDLPPMEVSDKLKNRILAQLDEPSQTKGLEQSGDSVSPDSSQQPADPHKKAAGNLPRCLNTLIPDGLKALPWKHLSPSISAAKLCNDVNGSKVEVIKIKPGGQVAAHNHTGEEITLVLEGSFSDSAGVYNRGDIIFRNKDDKHHRPIASQDAECVCLTSVEAPIQFTGFFARLFNPFIRRSHYSS
ncbi:anti-sigma factor [Aestuariicella hydrocarbonica]|uniref:Anti-sigma factor n=1 Tax=Pseudomaricurvus hydrocarbonicus TaxID=1470433 RepID=A0A9E5JTY1_9GAMM|nr:ChrR family anti-sigma-E factor [Aestuariicella hydrocarbonica]NHO64500.1 anti-sigma factor [Aestuariicella hydrocarbonica]